jgi:hypothetical protein
MAQNLRITLATVVALAASVAASGPAAATPPQDVSIVTLTSYLPASSFTWSSTGAFADEGTFDFTSAHWGGIPSPAVGTLQLGMTLTGTQGTIDLRLELVATAMSTPGIFSFDGPWSVVGGTGAYADLRGTGKVQVTGRVDQQSTLEDPEIGTFTGRVHSD